jgi:tetratricopeptide (TPR) repeat protein
VAVGGPQEASRALEILGLTSSASDSGPGDDPQDLRTKAKILAAQPNRARRREAIAILEGLVGRKPVDPNDLYLLSALHESDGDWPKARERMEELLSLQGKSPAVLAYVIRALLRHNRTEEAAAYFARLESLAPAAPATIELKARILAARGKGQDAAELLTKFAEANEARLEPVALLLENLGQFGAAESLYRRFVERSRARQPKSVLSLARFLGRRGRIDDALELAEGAWATCPPEAVANASVVILHSDKQPAERSERVARRLEAAILAHPDKLSLEFDLANLRTLQGRYSDAEAILRRVAERDKKLDAPLNNLAWLLAIKEGPDADQALALIDRAVALAGETPNLLDTRALARLAKGLPELAIRDLEDAIAAQPTAPAYFHLARAYEAAGRRAEAALAMQKAKDLGMTAGDLHPLERPSFEKMSTISGTPPATEKGRAADMAGRGQPTAARD